MLPGYPAWGAAMLPGYPARLDSLATKGLAAYLIARPLPFQDKTATESARSTAVSGPEEATCQFSASAHSNHPAAPAVTAQPDRIARPTVANHVNSEWHPFPASVDAIP